MVHQPNAQAPAATASPGRDAAPGGRRRTGVSHFAVAWILCLLACGFAAADAPAAEPAASEWVRDGNVQARLVAERDAVTPGGVLTVGLHLRHDPKWHTYWTNPGTGYPTSIDWELPEGFEAGEIRWPTPTRYIGQGGISVGHGYEDDAVLLVELRVPEDLTPGESVRLAGRADWLMCDPSTCIPGSAELAIELPVRAEAGDPAHEALFTEAMASLPEPAPDAWVSWDEADGRPRLSVTLPLPEGAEVASAHFMPLEGGKLRDEADQPMSVDGSRVSLTLTPFKPGPMLSDLPGVLRVELASGRVLGFALGVDDAPVDGEGAEAPAGGGPAAAADLGDGAPVDGAGRSAASEAAPASLGGLAIPLWQALGWAFLGGVILNLMPCVFPVLSIKVMSFVGQAGESRGRVLLHGLAYTVGIVLSFWIIAAVVIGLRGAGEQVGWGFQLQNPVFVSLMALLMFAIGLNLLGVFEIGVGMMNVAGAASGKLSQAGGSKGLSGSLFSGGLAVALATPCAAPFAGFGVAMGGALAGSWIDTVSIFTAMAIGLAAPYLVLSLFPAGLKVLPKPGPWMETLKQVLAFPILLVAVGLVWLFGTLAGNDASAILLLSMLLLGGAAWLAGRFRGRWSAPLGGVIAAGAIAVGVVGAMQAPGGVASPASATLASSNPSDGSTSAPAAPVVDGEIQWEKFSPELVRRRLAEGRPVFIDFTADWCMTCKFYERVAIDQPAVHDAANRHNVAMIKADWTKRDPVITEALSEFNRRAVPFYVAYSPDPGVAAVTADALLTPGAVVEMLDHAASAGAVTARGTAAPVESAAPGRGG